MENIVHDDTDIKINHSVGCQVFYFLIGIFLLVSACVSLFVAKDQSWHRFIFAPLLAIGSLYVIFHLSYSFIKERIKKIPALVISRNSLILSRKNEEYNEIPFADIESFKRIRKRTGRNSHTTYIYINYNDDNEVSNKYEKIERIDCSGLNMRDMKLYNLLKERLDSWKQRNGGNPVAEQP